MNNKKLLWLPLVLLMVLTVLTVGVLTACGGKDQPDNEPSESLSQPEDTAPEQTEPEETEQEETEPEETQPEETEPEETEAPGNDSSRPNVNTGTGGGYDPGASDPGATEPGEPTEPAIEVPPAGSENNPYYENVKNGAGKFTTVKIPAGGKVHYRIQTAGTFLQIEDSEISVTWNEETYEPQDGKLELELPGDEEAPISISFTNKGEEDKNFGVFVAGNVGSQSNPIDPENPSEIQVSLEQDDLDGVFYRYIAQSEGMLKLWSEGDSSVELNVLINAEPVQLTQDNGGRLCAQVKAEDEVLIQVLARADEEGTLPAAQTVIRSYIAQMVKYSVMLLPFEAEPVTVPAGQSVYFTLSGVSDRYISLAAENACLYYGEQTVESDENGILAINSQEAEVQIEVCNRGEAEAVYVLQVNNPLGSILNPQVLTVLGDEISVKSTTAGGYYFSYTAPSAGVLTFQIWTYPENASAVPNILLSNKTTGETASIAGSEEGTVSIPVMAADEVQIYAAAENILGDTLDDQMGIMGNLYGTQENPILVQCSGFTAKIPAGQTLYYQGYNMNGVIFGLPGSNAIVSHNGEEHSGEEIAFSVVCQGRDPGVFAITNPGEEDASYQVSLTYPLGWMDNPAPLVMGTNTLIQEAGAGDYYYTFTAQKDGKLNLGFDASAQWTYTVNNLTQGIYGDIQWSDSEPVAAKPVFDLKKGDVIQLSVNTYDKDNVNENPAGTVVFTASFVTGPVEIADTGIYTTATLIAGEACEFTGNFQGLTMRISGSTNAAVEMGGKLYKADATGTVKVEIPEGGTDKLSFILHNHAASKVQFTILFSSQSVGSMDNPEKISAGSYSMVQSVTGGNDHYYKIMADKAGTLTITFETDVDCIFIINGNIVRYTHMGQNKYTMRVGPGASISLVVNTYDPANPMVSPIGTVDFTVTIK